MLETAVVHPVVDTAAGFADAWDSAHNFIPRGECAPFSLALPAVESLIDRLRHDDDVRLSSGLPGDRVGSDPVASDFLRLPIARALDMPFHLSHFHLDKFFGPGDVLDGFEERVLVPWEGFLEGLGFSWDRCYAGIFVVGGGRSTNYHLDCINVLAWQVAGKKVFHTLRDRERWAPIELAVQADWRNSASRPREARLEDVASCTMEPGDLLWNPFLMPHWVDASDDGMAASICISHIGLRYQGRLCAAEEHFRDWSARQSPKVPNTEGKPMISTELLERIKAAYERSPND